MYVQSNRAGLRGMASLTRCLADRLRVTVTPNKRVVDRPWHGTLLGDPVTNHLPPRVQPAPQSVPRATARMRQRTHRGRGRHLRVVIEDIQRFTREWIGSCRLARVQAPFEMLDHWRRRRVRKILWEQWRTPKTRCRKLIARGLAGQRARTATATGLGAWWHAGASHRHAAVKNRVLAAGGLQHLLAQPRAMQRSTCTAVYGPVRTVVWGDGKGDLPSHPIS